MIIKRLLFLLAFFFISHLTFSQDKDAQNTLPSNTQTQKKTKKKTEVKKVPPSSNKIKSKTKEITSKMKTNTQKQRMKKFMRKTAVKRRHGLKRK